MNRRNFLTALGAVGPAAVAATVIPETRVMRMTEVHPEKQVAYQNLYEEAQYHIDSLELEVKRSNETLSMLSIQPNDPGPYFEIVHDGTDLILRNGKTGNEIRI